MWNPAKALIVTAIGTSLATVPVAAQGDSKSPKEQAKKPEKHQPGEVPEVLVIGRRQEDGVPTVPLDSIGSRDVMGPEFVRETGARDLNDLVQNLPALSSRPYNGGEAAAPSFSMRGLPDDGLTEYVQVLIDGVPASPLPYGWTAFSFLPVTTERVWAVDYIRGGHSVRYSPNTVGGVLNFVSQPIPRERLFETRSTFGAFDYSSHLVSAGGRLGELAAIATYVDRRGDGYRRDGGFDQQDLNVKFRVDTGTGSFVASSISYMEDEHAAPGGLTQAQFIADRFANARPENRFDGHRAALDVLFHESIGSEGWVEPYAWFSQTKRHLRAQRPHFGTQATVSDWYDTSYVGAVGIRAERQLELFGQQHVLYGGARYQREWIPSWKLSSEPFPSGPRTLTQDADYSIDALSLHIDDTFVPIENLTVNAGFRLEWVPRTEGDDRIGGWSFEDDFLAVLPGVGVSYALADNWAVFGSYFEGFRAPQVWGYAFTKSTEALEFEKGRSFELGTRVDAVCGVRGSLTGWRIEYDDFGVFFSGFYENLGRIVAHGADLVVDWDAGASVEWLEGFGLGGSITIQDSELRSGPNRGNETPYAWETKATWRARYETEDGWRASLGGTHVGESFSDDANTRQASADGRLGINPAWTLWDARVSKRFAIGESGSLEVAIGATNLFDKDWHVHSRGGFFGPGLVAGPPRQEYVALSFSTEF